MTAADIDFTTDERAALIAAYRYGRLAEDTPADVAERLRGLFAVERRGECLTPLGREAASMLYHQ